MLQTWQKQSIPELQKTLSSLEQSMLDSQYKTQYSTAEQYRTQYEACKNYILQRNLSQTDNNFQKQCLELNRSRNTQLQNCQKYWNQKMREYSQQCTRLSQQLSNKYEKQEIALRLEMQQQLSKVVKQSNQLINLRKMQQHAAKQKNFIEAHSIQQKVNKLYQKEMVEWMEGREKTIQLALKNLRNRQGKESQGVDRRIKLAQEDYAKDRFLDQLHINQKFDNLLKELKAKYEREVLSINGELRNSGGKSPTKKKKKSLEKSQEKSVSNQTEN